MKSRFGIHVLSCIPLLLAGALPIAGAEIAADAKAVWLEWTGGAMRRAGFDEERIKRTLTHGGTVVAWGSNKDYRDNYAGQARVPVGLSGVIAISAGWAHTVALKRDGTVVAWGSNDEGQSTVPSGLAGVVAIAAGGNHTVAMKSDGTVVAWGEKHSTVPTIHSKVVGIAAGGYHSVALTHDGKVVAWGVDYTGQVNVPPWLSDVVAIAAGQYHTVALKRDGTVAAWGNSNFDQLRAPDGLSGVVAIAAGDYHTMALKRDGTVVAWGANTDGRAKIIRQTTFFSDKIIGQTSVPAGLSGVVAIAAGGYHSVALKANGTLVAWGSNEDFSGNYAGQAKVPVGLNGVVAITAGFAHTVALRLDLTPAEAQAVGERATMEAKAAAEAQAAVIARAKIVAETQAANVAKATKSLVELQKRRAASGDAQAAFDLALRYTKGDGVPQDIAEAKRLLQQAIRNAGTATLKQKAQTELDRL